KADLVPVMVEAQPDAGGQERERGGGGPGLGSTGHRIGNRPAPAPASESAEEFRQPQQILVARSVKHAGKNLGCVPLQAITAQAQRDERIVVRPHRSIMIRYWVVSAFPLRNGADSPAAESLWSG